MRKQRMPKAELDQLAKDALAAWNNHDADAWVNLFADQFTWHDWSLPEPIRDKEGVRSYFSEWMRAFPDLKSRETRRIVGEDALAIEVEWTATNSGPLAMGDRELPPTNKKVTGRGSHFARVRDGKIV